jgi:hypothetical protein
LPIERPNKGISISIFSSCDGSFRLDDGVNPTHSVVSVRNSSTVIVLHTSVGDFGGYLEEIMIPDVSVYIVLSMLGRHCSSGIRDAFDAVDMDKEAGILRVDGAIDKLENLPSMERKSSCVLSFRDSESGVDAGRSSEILVQLSPLD